MEASRRWLRRLLLPVALGSVLAGWAAFGATLGASAGDDDEFEAGGLLLTVDQTERLGHHAADAATSDELANLELAEGTEARVNALDGSFNAENIQISPGTKVIWTNQGRDTHDIVPVQDNAAWGVDLADFGPGMSYEHTFEEAGVYRYICTVHPNMIGQVVVGDEADVEEAGGFEMPQSMTPGMQAEDEDRIHVEVSVRNTSEAAKDYQPDDFRLVSSSGDAWPLNEDSLKGSTLPAGYATGLDLYFDVPTGQEGLSVEWSVDSSTEDIPLDLDDHDHSDEEHDH